MRALLGVAAILGFVTVLFEWAGVAYILSLTAGGAAGFAALRKGGPRTYFRGLDEVLYAGERAIVAVSLLVMAVAVFLDVIWRTAHSMEGATARPFLISLFVLFMLAGYTTRWPGASLVKRMVAGLLGYGLFIGFVLLVKSAENGFGWSQKLALVLLLWVGLLGGSMATREGRHIAVDAVKRVVPLKYKRGFEVAGGLVTVAVCVLLAILGAEYARGNWADWIDSEMRAADFESLPVPYWAATLPIPIGFGLMAARFFAIVLYGAKEIDVLTSVGAGGGDDEANP